MPSPEHQGTGGSRQEQEPTPACYRATPFAGEEPAGKAYFKAQEAIFSRESALSADRFHPNHIWHVAVLGEQPPEELHQLLATILSTGEPTSLPADLLRFLETRRLQARQIGPWVEGHY